MIPILLFFVTGCASGVSDGAICDGTKSDRKQLANALYEDGGDQSVIKGSQLIRKIDAACSDL